MFHTTERKYIVTDFRDKNYMDLIHSWDICNEPRNIKMDGSQGDTEAISKWVQDSVQAIRGVDEAHPITVGTEGFFNMPGE
jgi:hypothetical protein